MSTELLDQLTVIDRKIEEHKTGIWILQRQRDDVRALLVKSGWSPPAEVEP